LLVAGGLVVACLGAAIVGRMNGGGVEPPTAPATAERTLNFADRDDGAVVITLAGPGPQAGQVLDVVTGQAGFLRSTLRGFARTRRLEGIGSVPPLRLTGYADGRLILFDPSTSRQVELEAFGHDNELVFARLLTMAPMARTASTGQGHA
jgi:putative photosynthetic complex assembly protein